VKPVLVPAFWGVGVFVIAIGRGYTNNERRAVGKRGSVQKVEPNLFKEWSELAMDRPPAIRLFADTGPPEYAQREIDEHVSGGLAENGIVRERIDSDVLPEFVRRP